MKLTEHNEKVLQQFSEMMISRMEQVKAGDWEKGWLGAPRGDTFVKNAKAYDTGIIHYARHCNTRI